jgi:hypothetical protein
MKHQLFLLDITEWILADENRKPASAAAEAVNLLMEQGYESLERKYSDLLA